MRRLAWTLLLLCLAAPSAAGTLAGVSMPDRTQISGEDLVLNGMGLRKKFFVKVYVAGLYLPAKVTAAEAVLGADAPRRMVMHWLYGVGKEAICEGWDEGLAANTVDASDELRRDFQRLCGWMADAESGDRHVFTYRPGSGTEVEIEGEVKGTIEGKAFADALLACWIGPDPGPGQKFKADLLGGS